MLYCPQPELEDNARLILCFVSVHGPVTMYRVARELSLHFSYAYRKASMLEHMGLLKKVSESRANLYDSTMRGLVYSYLIGCSTEVVLYKIAKFLGLTNFSQLEVESFLKFYFSIADRDAPLSNLSVMVSYILERCGKTLCRDRPEMPLASRVIAYGLIQMVQRYFGNSIILVDRDYFAIVNDKEVLAAHCRLCGRDKYCTYVTCDTLRSVIEIRLRNS